MSRPKVEMVCIAKDDLCPKRLYVFWSQCLDRGLSADGHEAGSIYLSMWCCQNSKPSGRETVFFYNFELDHLMKMNMFKLKRGMQSQPH